MMKKNTFITLIWIFTFPISILLLNMFLHIEKINLLGTIITNLNLIVAMIIITVWVSTFDKDI